MTFDEAFEKAAHARFERRAELEITLGDDWVPCDDEDIIRLVFSDRSIACALAHSEGVQLSDGRNVRFCLTPNAELRGAHDGA